MPSLPGTAAMRAAARAFAFTARRAFLRVPPPAMGCIFLSSGRGSSLPAVPPSAGKGAARYAHSNDNANDANVHRRWRLSTPALASIPVYSRWLKREALSLEASPGWLDRRRRGDRARGTLTGRRRTGATSTTMQRCGLPGAGRARCAGRSRRARGRRRAREHLTRSGALTSADAVCVAAVDVTSVVALGRCATAPSKPPCQRSTLNASVPAVTPATATIPAILRPRFSSRCVSPHALAVRVGPDASAPAGMTSGAEDRTVGAIRHGNAGDPHRHGLRRLAHRHPRKSIGERRHVGEARGRVLLQAPPHDGLEVGRHFGTQLAQGVGASRMIFADTSAFDSPSYGGVPVMSAWRMALIDQMSARVSTSRVERSCSGDMKHGVPITVAVLVRSVAVPDVRLRRASICRSRALSRTARRRSPTRGTGWPA